MNALASLVPPPYSLSSRVSSQSSFRNIIYGRSTFTFETVDHLLRKPGVFSECGIHSSTQKSLSLRHLKAF